MTAATARRPVLTRRRSPRPSAVAPHAYVRDWQIPTDGRGRSWCRTCHLPGAVGDDRHPDDAPPAFPDAPDEARALDARILGEAAGGR